MKATKLVAADARTELGCYKGSIAYRETDLAALCVVCKLVATEQCDACGGPLCKEHQPRCRNCSQAEVENDAAATMAAALEASKRPLVGQRDEKWVHPLLSIPAVGLAVVGLTAFLSTGFFPIWIGTIGGIMVGQLALYKTGHAQRWSRKLFERDARRKLRKIEKEKSKQLQARAQKALPPPSDGDSP